MIHHRIKLTMALLASLSASAATAFGQNPTHNYDIDKTISNATWLDKDAAKKLKDVVVWQNIEKIYNDTVSSLQWWQKELRNAYDKKSRTDEMAKSFQLQLFSMQYDGEKKRSDEQMFDDYDRSILLLHQGVYGNDFVERQQQALLICHKAESALFDKYSEASVNNALYELGAVKDILPSVCNDIIIRLKNYKTMTNVLKTMLEEAEKTNKDQLSNDLPDISLERFTRDYFKVLQNRLSNNPSLLDPHQYPYLYAILKEVMMTKLDDRRNNIDNLINKL